MESHKPAVEVTKADLQAVLDVFLTMKIGDVVTYDEMHARVGFPVRSEELGYTAQLSAREAALREHNVFIDIQFGNGFVRTDESGRLAAGERRLRRAVHHTKKGAVVTASADPMKLTPEERITQSAIIQTSALILGAASEATQKRLRVHIAKVAELPNPNAFDQTLKLFAK